jgi:hypothetical protein
MTTNVGAVRGRLENTTEGIGDAATVTTGVRVFSPTSQTTGSGVPDAARAVSGTETTITTPLAALGVSAIGAIGGYYALRNR